MAKAIEFDVERLLGRLNILEGTQVRYASRRALTRWRDDARIHLALQMAFRFDKPVSRTLSSALYDRQLIEEPNSIAVRLFINPDTNKGNAPASYIRPTDRGSGDATAYATKFGVGLRKTGITSKFPVPYTEGQQVQRNRYGNMMPSQYNAVLQGLQRSGSGIFALPNGSPGGRLPQGIYTRVRKDKRWQRTAYLLFALYDEAPSVDQRFDFEGITRFYAQRQLPKLLREELAKALR